MHPTGSLRSRPLDQTLALARELGPKLGIERVTEITPLDRFGLPVFAAVRPTAVPGSLCVSAGKGMLAAEAKVGAYMEGIEMAMAEWNRAQLPIQLVPAAEVGEGRFSLAELAPLPNHLQRGPLALGDSQAKLACVRGQDLTSGRDCLVPAELVFFPFPKDVPGLRLFGSSGNGLSSGNERDEAIVHALCELIERDTMAFQRHRDQTRRVRPESLPGDVQELVARADQLGYDLWLRTAENPFAMPFFIAAISDRENRIASHFGTGCHPLRQIALRRAVTEALQSRLTSIHGARDDLPDFNRRLAHLSRSELPQTMEQTMVHFARLTDALSLSAVAEHPEVESVASGLACLMRAIHRVLDRSPIVVGLSPSSWPLHVVRVIVPRMEANFPWLPRLGPRLQASLRS